MESLKLRDVFQKFIGRIPFLFLIFTILMIGIVDASGEIRIISLFHIHTKEKLTILYKKDGKYLPKALEKLNWILRDWRRNEATEIDPKAIDIAWEMHAELGSQMPIHIVCGYRSRETNNMLINSVGGQATNSQHISGKAIDLSFPDIPIRRIRYSAMIRELGGVGYYPTSAIPFVHIDTGRVRSWPRMPHNELALLFPRGHSQHISAEGKMLQPEDFLAARRREPQLAEQVSQFFDIRDKTQKRILVASTEMPPFLGTAVVQNFSRDKLHETTYKRNESSKKNDINLIHRNQKGVFPQLILQPKLVERSSHFSKSPTEGDRLKLTELVSAAELSHSIEDAPRLKSKPHLVQQPKKEKKIDITKLQEKNKISQILQSSYSLSRINNPLLKSSILSKDEAKSVYSSNEWAASPPYDDDHPDELSYQPFPILSLLTNTASYNDPVLSRLVHPNIAKTLEMIDADGNILPMRLRPGMQTALLYFSQKFSGNVVDLSVIEAEKDQDILQSLGFIKRVVTTSQD